MKFVSLFLMSLFISFKSFCADAGLVMAVMQQNLIGQFNELCDAKIAELEGSIADVSSISSGANPHSPGSEDAIAWEYEQTLQREDVDKDLEGKIKSLNAWRTFKSDLEKVFTVAFIQKLNTAEDDVSIIEALVKRKFELTISFSDVNKIMAPLPSQVFNLKKEIRGMGAEKFAEKRELYLTPHGQWVSSRAAAVGLEEGGVAQEVGSIEERERAAREERERASSRFISAVPRLSSVMTGYGFGGRAPAGYGDLPIEEVDDVYCPSAPAGMAYDSRFGYTPPPPVQHGMRYGGVGMPSVGDYPSVYGRGTPVSASPPMPYDASFGPARGYRAPDVYGRSASAASSLPALTNGGLSEGEALAKAMAESALDARQRADSDEAPTGHVYEGGLTDRRFQELSMMIRYHDGGMVDNPAAAADYFDAQVIGNRLETNSNLQIFIDSVNSLLTEEGFNKKSFDAVVESSLHRGK